ncbi:MAG TPA: acetyltransferase [Acidimicrobiales bacterium]|nr:acetyltransferase [Acidimicrobiales bacterium]
MTPLVIIGSGGHGRETLDIVEAIHARSPSFEFIGFIDERRDNEPLVVARGARIIGSLTTMRERDRNTRYVIGIGSGDTRRAIDRQLTEWGFEPAVLVHPDTTTGAGVTLGAGAVIAAGVRITTNVTLGRHAHVNVNATVSHDCRLADYVTISPGVTVSGNVSIGEGTLMGAGSTVIQNLSIGAWATVGAGAVVVTDLAAAVTAIGIPARPRPAATAESPGRVQSTRQIP